MSNRLDEAIDRAVREWLAVEPPAGLRARVVARLPGGGQRPASFLTRAASAFRRKRWVFAPALAAAVILLAIVVMRRSEPVRQAPVAAHGVDRRLPLEIVETPIATARATRHPIGASARAPRGGGPVAAASLDEEAGAGLAIDPLSSIAPIAIAPIRQRTIAPAAIAMRTLNPIQDVELAPLTPLTRR